MRRLHLFEIHEQPWCPAILRDGMRGVLQQTMGKLPGYEVILEDLLAALAAAGTTEVPRIGRVRLTDLYPDVAAMEAMQRDTDGLATPCAESVDALDTPSDLPGLRPSITSSGITRDASSRAPSAKVAASRSSR